MYLPQVQIEARATYASEAIVGIDDIYFQTRQCEEEYYCDFEYGLCNWKNNIDANNSNDDLIQWQRIKSGTYPTLPDSDADPGTGGRKIAI